jgi:N-(2-amino-2-carboxyethyl)-L-glutamate synthase
VTVISVPHEFNEDDLYVDLLPTFGQSLLLLKIEGFNFAGSIKLRSANCSAAPPARSSAVPSSG